MSDDKAMCPLCPPSGPPTTTTFPASSSSTPLPPPASSSSGTLQPEKSNDNATAVDDDDDSPDLVWIACNKCEKWFHPVCLLIASDEVQRTIPRSSVCRYLTKAGGWEVVGITRNPESDKAKALTGLGVKVVKGDLEDTESYKSHLEGLYGAYVNADFWATYFSNGYDGDAAGQHEYKQSTNAIDACAAAGAKHIVYSTLDSTNGLVPHMAYKQKVTEYAKSKNYPVTNLYTGHYISNLTKFDLLKPNGDGTFTLAMALSDDVPLINYAVEQTGGWVLPIFENPEEYIGARVDACSEIITLGEWAATLSAVSGKKISTPGLSTEAFLDGTEPKKLMGEEMYVNYLAFHKGLAPRNLEQSKKIYPELWDTKAWAAQSADLKKLLGF